MAFLYFHKITEISGGLCPPDPLLQRSTVVFRPPLSENPRSVPVFYINPLIYGFTGKASGENIKNFNSN